MPWVNGYNTNDPWTRSNCDMDPKPEDYDDHTAQPDTDIADEWDVPWPTEAGEPITPEEDKALTNAWIRAATAINRAHERRSHE